MGADFFQKKVAKSAELFQCRNWPGATSSYQPFRMAPVSSFGSGSFSFRYAARDLYVSKEGTLIRGKSKMEGTPSGDGKEKFTLKELRNVPGYFLKNVICLRSLQLWSRWLPH